MSINLRAIDEAIVEACRFIAAVEQVKAQSERTEFTKGQVEFCGDKFTAHAKRASMDLTRALADFRNNR